MNCNIMRICCKNCSSVSFYAHTSAISADAADRARVCTVSSLFIHKDFKFLGEWRRVRPVFSKRGLTP